jgi:hypothetical protein
MIQDNVVVGFEVVMELAQTLEFAILGEENCNAILG